MVAIEGKLKNWKQAVKQARRNQLFSVQSYVALDEYRAAKAIENLHIFKSYNLGLAIVSNSGDVSFKHRPKYQKPITSIMSVIAESSLLSQVN